MIAKRTEGRKKRGKTKSSKCFRMMRIVTPEIKKPVNQRALKLKRGRERRGKQRIRKEKGNL